MMERETNNKKEGVAMIKLSDGKYVIGFDNGYQFGKSATTMFENGVYPLDKVEPSIREHSLENEKPSRKSDAVGMYISSSGSWSNTYSDC
jgi:hypothetical protein